MIRVQTANIPSDVFGFSKSGKSGKSITDSLRKIVSHGWVHCFTLNQLMKEMPERAERSQKSKF